MAGTDVIVHADKTQYIHGVGAGTIVGTATTQTLTNKTIVGGTITGAVLTNCTGIDVSLDGKTGTGMTIVSSTLSGTTTNSGIILGGTISGGTISGGTIQNATLTGTITNSGTILNGTISGANLVGCTGVGTLTNINGLTGTGLTIVSSTLSGTITSSSATVIGGTYTGITLANPTMSLASSTDGDMWYQASGVVSRLAKGTASQIMRMNSGATAPEWGAASHGIAFTRAFSVGAGDTSYTGLGFKPRTIWFMGTAPSSVSWGMAFAGGTQVNINDTGSALASSASYCFYGSNGVSYYTFIVKSLDSDGFTLTWSKTGTGTLGTVYVYAFCVA